ncbi:low molecular weight protein-tyrosine-phosphatase [Nocardioides limicola]|uniref:low molecular weight protein-tyrosine-phosphatase n=1 Tax=Nocardioides limicola TaxID=2803368 RepID=UPI00193C7F50|nr:low molecular weight protein-tyrosine-phosphatase [Nocardioides sp. DJM-14]
MPGLPPPRHSGEYSVVLVCLGNICRSPVADVVLTARVAEAGLDDVVRVDSGGTGSWHVGDVMDTRSAATLVAAGYDPDRHRARHFDGDWLRRADLVLTMDRSNHADVLALAAPEDVARVRLFGDFDPTDVGGEVPDPYYGGPSGFTDVLARVERTCDRLVAHLAAELVRS